MVWFTLWFMVILKIPAVYLCWVIWWAVKDPPRAETEPVAALRNEDDGRGPRRTPGRARRPGRRDGPHGSPARRPQEAVRSGRARA